VVSWRREHPDAVSIEDDTVSYHTDIDCWFPRQVGMMGEAVLDVGTQRGEDAVHDVTGPGWTQHHERAWRERGDPTGGDDVVEIREVVAVEVGEEGGGELVGPDPDCGEAHEHAPPGVNEEQLAATADEGRRPGASRVG
jgi:hypothetical protein